MSRSNVSDSSRIVFACWWMVSILLEPIIISEKPTILFNGVRISWLIFAKNRLLALFAASALSFACFKASSVRLCSTISCCKQSFASASALVRSTTFSSSSSCAFCKNHNRRGLGFDRPLRPEGGPSSEYASDESFGHSGFTGALVWIDPKYDFVYIFLSNRIHPTSENNKLLKMDVRTKVQDLFYKSFPDLDTLKTTANIL